MLLAYGLYSVVWYIECDNIPKINILAFENISIKSI